VLYFFWSIDLYLLHLHTIIDTNFKTNFTIEDKGGLSSLSLNFNI
jgi:hypothetical protein